MISVSSAISGLPNSVSEPIPRPSGEPVTEGTEATGSHGATEKRSIQTKIVY